MSTKRGNIQGSFMAEKKMVDIKLSIISFEEDENTIVYCPALDISGYGKNEEEADQSFGISLSEFFQYTLQKHTLSDEMKRLGWTFKNMHKRMTPPNMSKLLTDNENFSRIFNEHSFRKYDKRIEIPVA